MSSDLHSLFLEKFMKEALHMADAHRIVIASIKGGTGKTTTAVTLSALLAKLAPTLLVDFDPQGQCAAHFGKKQKSGVADWLMLNHNFKECLYQGRPDQLKILPGDTSSKDVGYKFVAGAGAYPLAGELTQIEGFDYQVYDTAAGGFLQEAALIIADHVIIPFRTEGASVQSLKNILDVIRLSAAKDVRITLLPVAYQRQYAEHRRNLALVVDQLGDAFGVVEASAIPHRVAMLEAFAEGETVWEHSDYRLDPVRTAYALLAARVFVYSNRSYYNTLLESMYGAKE